MQLLLVSPQLPELSECMLKWLVMTMQYLYLCPHLKMFVVPFKNRSKGSSGRHRSARTPQDIATVQRDIQRNLSVNEYELNMGEGSNHFLSYWKCFLRQEHYFFLHSQMDFSVRPSV